MEYNQIIKTLHEKLPDYLTSQGIQVDKQGFFSCIHPDHPDRNPSCSLNYGKSDYAGKVFHCFSGNGHDGNIFTAAHWLENMPLVGQEFWDVTMKELCKRYDIPYEPLEVSEDQKRMYQAVRATSDAARIIKNMAYDGLEIKESHVGLSHLLSRGFTKETIKKFDVGVLTSFREYQEALEKLGHTDIDFLTAKGLLGKNIFNRDGFIIPIKNESGRTVGFVARNCRHAPNVHINQKYINSPNSDIYAKGEILFGYDKCKKRKGTNSPLYIVEGYLDAMMLSQMGMERVVAIGATVLTEYHITELLFNNDESDIVLCLDGDKGGYDGTRIAIERMSPYKKFNLKITDIPAGYDPDSYVLEFGIDEFMKLDKLSPFAWSLKHTEFSDDMVTVAQKIIPTIAAEKSSIVRLKMIQELSKFASLSEIDIRKDVDMLVNKEDDKYLKDISDINNLVQVQLSRQKIADTKTIIRDAMRKLEIVDDRHNSNRDIKGDYFGRLENLKERIVAGDYKFGLRAPKFTRFINTIDGIPFWANLMFLGGRPSAGKTAFMTALSLDVAEANEDAAIFYMSIDDPMDLLVTKMMAVRSGLATSEIKRYGELNKFDRDSVDEAHNFMKSIADRYIIADATQGNSLDVLENHVKWFCKEFPDKKKIFMLDNFHKLNLEAKGQNRKMDAISEASSRLKDISILNDICIIATVELRKLANECDRPTRQDMQGSNKLDYDADVIGLVHNDLQVNLDTRIIHESEVRGKMYKMPWIEVNIAKNKINGKTEQCVFKYDKWNMRMTEGSYQDWAQLKSSMQRRGMRSGPAGM